MNRGELLIKYLKGFGIEIGALQNPMDLSGSRVEKVLYVDRLGVKDLRKQYPELKDSNLTEPDIIDDGEELNKVPDDSLDFIIANHVIEHMENPINAIKNWLSKLCDGGIIFMAVPDKKFTFDKAREETTWNHLYDDYKNKKLRERRNYKHFLDFARAFPEKNKTDEKKANELIKNNYSIPFHCWTYSGFRLFLKNCIKNLKFNLKIIDSVKTKKGENEFIFILKKEARENTKGVDIIVPVYNAFYSLKKCINSVIEHTDFKNNRLIIIDDKSSDKRIFSYYKKLEAEKIENIKIYKNKENLGFVATVNKGMGLSDKNDVLLLNSDTIVTKNWLDKIKDCAYSSTDIATVTPLSNNATICSLPMFGYDNQLPEGFTLDTFAQLIEEKSLNRYYELPTGVGFCMFIKREIIDKFGVFDADLFGMGYGEENEYCTRVARHGFKNVVCDNTFIYHKGSASFTDERRIQKVKDHLKVIDKLYYGYSKSITDFVSKNPLKSIHSNVDFWIKHKELFLSKKKKILMVMHFEPSVGGVGINSNQICDNNSDLYDFYLFTTNEKGEVVIKVRENSEWTILWCFKNKKSDVFSIKNEEIENIFSMALDYLNINVVHFQHLMGFPLSLLTIPRSKNIKSILSLHDFYLISNSPQLIGCVDLEKFEFSSDGVRDAKMLLSDHYNINNKHGYNNDVYRLRWAKEYLGYVDFIISPSKYVKDLYETVMGLVENRIIVHEHGISIKKTLNITSNERKIVIAYLGVASNHKGFEDFVSLIQKSREKNIKWLIIGYISQEWLSYLNENNIFEKYDVELTGSYELSFIQKLIIDNKVDLIVLPSIFPETYSYTLSEAVQCNIPVIARDIGALGDRVKSNNYGWTFKDMSELVNIIHNLCKDTKLIKDKKVYLKNKIIFDVKEMALFYKKNYEKFSVGNHNENFIIDVVKTNRLFEKSIFREVEDSKDDICNIENFHSNKFKILIKNIPILGKVALRIKKAIMD